MTGTESHAAAGIVVGIDSSVNAERVLCWAADEAHIRGDTLQIVHVGEPSSSDCDLLGPAAAAVARLHPDIATTTVAVHGEPVAQLLHSSVTADLLVLGRSRHGVLGTPLGSVTASVLAHAHCPTAIVPRDRAGGGSSVVVGVSDSDGGMAALRFAFAEALRRNVELVALRSWWAHEVQLTGSVFPISSPDLPSRADRALLDRCVALVRDQFPTVPVRTVLTGQEPDIAFDQEVPDAALLVLGCRRGDETRRSRLGALTSWATRHIGYPVVVVGHPAHLTRTHEMGGEVTEEAGAVAGG
jgi:nucleotide-binding universal stress UspA family protein